MQPYLTTILMVAYIRMNEGSSVISAFLWHTMLFAVYGNGRIVMIVPLQHTAQYIQEKQFCSAVNSALHFLIL